MDSLANNHVLFVKYMEMGISCTALLSNDEMLVKDRHQKG